MEVVLLLLRPYFPQHHFPYVEPGALRVGQWHPVPIPILLAAAARL